MAWLSVLSTIIRNRAKSVRPGLPKGFVAVPGAGCGIRSGGRLAMPVTTMKIKKFPENTDQARLKTWPTRKSPCVNRPAGSDASVMGHPCCDDMGGIYIRHLSQ